MYLISIYFDEETNKILNRHIQRIAKATGNGFMTENNVPPHMTISAFDARDVKALEESFEKLKGLIEGGDVQFVSIGQLLPYVIYATPVMNEYLLNLSKYIFNAFKDIPDIRISKYYKPYSWLPHVTLGKTLDKMQIQKALEILQDSFVPFNAQIKAIGLSRVNPHRDLIRFDFASQ
mgnify:CR=1 FL=1